MAVAATALSVHSTIVQKLRSYEQLAAEL